MSHKNASAFQIIDVASGKASLLPRDVPAFRFEETTSSALSLARYIKSFLRQLTKISRTADLLVVGELSNLETIGRLVNGLDESRICAILLHEDGQSISMLPSLLRRFKFPKALYQNLLLFSDEAVFERIILAKNVGAEADLIADAAVVDGHLYVRNCALEELQIPLTEIDALNSLSTVERTIFEVDDDGSFLYWPAGDVHLDLEALRCVIDPGFIDNQRAASIKDDRRYGKAIAQYRKKCGLSQSNIEGLTDRQVRRIEQGDTRPNEKSLRILARTHGISLGDYLDRLAENLGE